MLSLSISAHSAQQLRTKYIKMAHSKLILFAAVVVAFLAAVQAFPGPQPGPAGPVGPVGPAPVRPEADKGEKSDLKAENSYGFGYAYGGYGGPYGYGHPYSYGYGYPYGYAYNYPYYGGGLYGGYPYWG